MSDSGMTMNRTIMLCDAQAQYGDYSELEKCPMWGMWVKEGGE